MDLREKLVELLEDDNCPLLYVLGENFAALADYLIKNGVTVLEWIPVTERLPDVGEPVLVSARTRRARCGVGEYSNTYRCFFVAGYGWTDVTHWMPLPKSPKEEAT